jgi:RNA polymerase sigma-32 factor
MDILEVKEKYRAMPKFELMDTLSCYFSNIRPYPLIPAELQLRLIKLYQEGDQEAGDILIKSNFRFVISIAKKYSKSKELILDLIQEGNLGLVVALQRFDLSKKVNFLTYASHWVRAYISAFFNSNNQLVRLSTTDSSRHVYRNYKKVKQRLLQETGSASNAEIARILGVKEYEVEAFGSYKIVSMIAEVDYFNKEYHLAEELEMNEYYEKLNKAVEKLSETLDERERAILRGRVFSEEERTLKDLGDMFGLSKERIRQIELRLIAKLKDQIPNSLN